MARKVKLPNGIIGMVVKPENLSRDFETEKDVLNFFDRVRHRRTGKIYRKADALLRDYVGFGDDILVEVD